MWKWTLAVTAVVMSAAACGQNSTVLRPGENALVAPVGPGEGAVASDAGVRLEVRSRAWSGDPPTLETEITPLLVKITNDSPHPMLVRYEDLTLTQGGIRYTAIAWNPG